MAIYHLSVKPISRTDGRSATAAAAYRAGVRITDERTGEIHDYTRKGGIEFAAIVAPFGVKGAYDREALWNAAELAEKRKDSRVAREFEIALPEELPAAERRRIAVEFARELVERYGIAADVAIHAPSRDGDDRNHHAHILCTTRQVKSGENGELVLGEKVSLELSEKKRAALGLCSGAEEVIELRALWAQVANRSLEHYTDQRVDHRSLKDQGIADRLPQVHLGPAVTQMHRRGVKSDKWLSWEQANEALQAATGEAARLAKVEKALNQEIIDTRTRLGDLYREQEREESRPAVAAPAARARPEPAILATPPSTAAPSLSEQAFAELRKRFPNAEWKPASAPQPQRGCVLKGSLVINQERHSVYESLDGKALVMCSPRPHLGFGIRVDGDASSAQELVAGIVKHRAGQGLTTMVNGVEAGGRGRGR